MLNNLTESLGKIVKTVRGHARLTEENITQTIREVRIALLEADVALSVVKELINKIKERALGKEVIGSLTPGQAFIGVVNEVLTEIMGQDNHALNLSVVPPAVILMAGLQGAGKTTTVGKLAHLLTNKNKKKVLLVSTDVYRPAAIEQLATLSFQIEVDCFASYQTQKPVDIAINALDYAKKHYYDVLIVDTAGRLAIDQQMMNEIKALHQVLNPIETLFVVDAMLGQDAVNTAKAFDEALALTGIILTKMDGDTRGGAALSIKYITGKPIKFIGIGEKINGLEAFYPDRLANRILGMGDVLGLIEEVQQGIDQAQAIKMAKKIRKGKGFDLNDFQLQLKQMKTMGGGVGSMISKLGMGDISDQVSEEEVHKATSRTEAIINAMTPKERANPQLIKASRKRRIALGSGTSVQEVNRLLKQFEQAQKMMKQLTKGGMGKLMQMAKGFKDLIPR